MRRWLFLGMLLASTARAQCFSLNGHPLTFAGTPACMGSSSNPLALPLTDASTPVLTYLGSFELPTDITYYGGAITTSGSDMYISSEYAQMAEVTIPTLSGTPATNGSNAPAPCNSTPCSGSGLVVAPTTLSSTGFLSTASGCSSQSIHPTGALVYGGELYVTAGVVYDASQCTLAFITGGSSISTLGTPNSSSTAANTYQRFFSGSLGILPSIWQPYFGGPCYVTSGNSTNDGLSIATASPSGFDFATFNCSAYSSSGGSIPVTEYVDYYWGALADNPNPDHLMGRDLNGPYPLAGGGGCSLTLASAPTAAATTATLSATFTGSGCGNQYDFGWYQVTFNDVAGGTETRVVHLCGSADGGCTPSASIPDGQFACSSGCTSFAPLTCSSGCTTAVTVNAMGDNYASEYDGAYGTGFIVPGTRSLWLISVHSYGPSGEGGEDGSGACASGSSGANDVPIAPDTLHYQRLQITAYDLAQVYEAYESSEPVYTVTPYAEWDFPNWQANWGGTNNCVQISPGSFYFDPLTNILYGVFTSNALTDGYLIVNEWSVTPVTSWNAYGPASNDETFRAAA